MLCTGVIDSKDNKIFKMPKFRTIVINTPELATDKLQDPYQWLTPIGDFLRKSSLDELPQIFCVFVGKMSFVGPRPALYNQYELIEMRTKIGIHRLLPGITGWAQINGRMSLIWKIKLHMINYIYKKICFI